MGDATDNLLGHKSWGIHLRSPMPKAEEKVINNKGFQFY